MDEVRANLKMKSIDAAARWCLANKVNILKSGNRNVVIEYEFKIAFEKPIIERLKSIYGSRWEEYYAAYDSENVLNYFKLEKAAEHCESGVGTFDATNFLKQIGYGKS